MLLGLAVTLILVLPVLLLLRRGNNDPGRGDPRDLRTVPVGPGSAVRSAGRCGRGAVARRRRAENSPARPGPANDPAGWLCQIRERVSTGVATGAGGACSGAFTIWPAAATIGAGVERYCPSPAVVRPRSAAAGAAAMAGRLARVAKQPSVLLSTVAPFRASGEADSSGSGGAGARLPAPDPPLGSSSGCDGSAASTLAVAGRLSGRNQLWGLARPGRACSVLQAPSALAAGEFAAGGHLAPRCLFRRERRFRAAVRRVIRPRRAEVRLLGFLSCSSVYDQAVRPGPHSTAGRHKLLPPLSPEA